MPFTLINMTAFYPEAVPYAEATYCPQVERELAECASAEGMVHTQARRHKGRGVGWAYAEVVCMHMCAHV